MLDRIEFENYRCYEKTKLNLRDISIIVGKNNSGKSTIIEALRIIALAGKKSKKCIYVNSPKEFNIPSKDKGFKIDITKLKVDLRGIIYYYGDKIAKITAIFKNKSRIVIYLNKESVFACIYDENNNIIKNKSIATKYNFDCLDILPQIGLIKENEKLLSEDTVENYKDTYLSSRHFRNELLLYKDTHFKEFKKLAEETWPGLRILSLEYKFYQSEYIQLLVEDNRFTAELGLMGSGLQMWLQIIWFICRTRNNNTIILDEPDVYMHPDLQRKIFRLVKSRYSQVIIATHSIEIISEVEARNIVTVDKQSRQMKYANDSKAVQSIIDEIGGIQNISLLRIGNAKKCLFVEGKDVKLLSAFYNILYPNSEISFESLPYIQLGGFTRLNEAFGAARLFYKETLGQIKCFCILDRDYYTEEFLNNKIKEANESKLDLHIWNKKEIENYLLNPKVIFKITKLDKNKYNDFLVEYEKIIDSFEVTVFDNYSQQVYNSNNGRFANKTCNEIARDYMKKRWTNLENKTAIVGGKEAIKAVCNFIKDKYKQSCSINKIINSFNEDEIDTEIKDIINLLIN